VFCTQHLEPSDFELFESILLVLFFGDCCFFNSFVDLGRVLLKVSVREHSFRLLLQPVGLSDGLTFLDLDALELLRGIHKVLLLLVKCLYLDLVQVVFVIVNFVPKTGLSGRHVLGEQQFERVEGI
jgi:hypothetical protein